ncbi:hypothetical protein ACFL6K_06530 [Candidatus Latescibacterota bacterium]
MKKDTHKVPRFCYILFVALIIIMCLGAKESLCAEDDATEIVTKKKSYILGGAGALVCPAIGHSYIGGKNMPRSVLYTGIEIASGLFLFTAAMAPVHGGAEQLKYYSTMFIATHVISFADALISTNIYNKSVTNVSILPGKSSVKLMITKTF